MMRKITDDVIYIGLDDFDIDLFESQYKVPQGVSYNSYLILDEKIAILDTADAGKGEEWETNLKKALGERKPDYLVVHHLEPDHSSMIARVLEIYPDIRIVTGARAAKMIPQFFNTPDIGSRCIEMKEGDVLDLGKHKLHFYAAPMVHWPEVMVSFDEFDGALYSADAFGKFGALSKFGFYSSEDPDWSEEARRYYINIVGKYGAQVQNLLKKASALPIKSIRPLHGPIINEDLGKYIKLYDIWSSYSPESKGIMIAVASIYGGTMKAAEKLKELLESKGAENVFTRDLCRTDISRNVSDAFRYDKLVLAASSYDNGLFTPMYNFLHILQIKCYAGRTVGIIENGSWAPSAARVMNEMLCQMSNLTIVEPVVTIRSRMKSTDYPALEHLADALL
ncbi:MAG: FprA family A-type flavoprotein [Bacteroidales bacterium]|nr:FprA family A-type flavoprotein [Bacteroidales bacterium]